MTGFDVALVQPGDRVAWTDRYRVNFSEVSHLTPTQIVLNDKTRWRRADGTQIGGSGYYRTKLMSAKGSRAVAYAAANQLMELRYQVDQLLRDPANSLNQVKERLASVGELVLKTHERIAAIEAGEPS